MRITHTSWPALLAAGVIGALPGLASAVDLSVGNVEFTQVIQPDMTTLVPLVRGRETWVRVIVNTDETSVGDVDVVLIRDPEGVARTYEDVGLGATGPKTILRPDLIDYETTTHTFDFCVVHSDPIETWRIVVDPEDLVSESDESNNTFDTTTGAIELKEPRICGVPISFGLFGPDRDVIATGVGDAYVRAVLPTRDMNYDVSAPFTYNKDVNDVDSGFHTKLNRKLETWRRRWSRDVRPDIAYGWIGYPVDCNGWSQVGGRSGFGTAVDLARYQRTMMHELGHMMGLCHAGSGCTDGFEASSTFTTGDVGVDPLGYLNRGVLQSSALFDVMRNGQVTADAWASWEEVFAWVNHPYWLPITSGTFLEDVMLVQGRISDGSVEVDRVLELDADERTEDEASGAYRVRTRAAGTTIDVVTFDLDIDLHAGLAPESFSVAVVRDDGVLTADEVVLERVFDGAILWSRSANAAPTATLDSHGPGANILPGESVTWTTDDPDGDPVEVAVQWSWDDGATWMPIDAFTDGGSITWPDVGVAGADPGEGRVRLLVTDGFTTTVTEVSDLGHPIDESPSVTILSPGSAAVATNGQILHLAASVYDDEEVGPVEEACITWSSDVDGIIGIGRRLGVDDLTTGAHVLTVEAKDADGNIASASIEVLVGDDGKPGGGPICDAPIRLNEVRVAAPSPNPQDDEFIELRGPAGLPLDGLCIVILDQDGTVTGSVDLDLAMIPADGHFLLGRVATLPASGAICDLVAPFSTPDGGNSTVLLVCADTCVPVGADLDPDGDGTLNVTPWASVLDSVAAIGDLTGSSWSPNTRGPSASGNKPAALRRCPPVDFWVISPAPVPGLDTPGDPNPLCPPSMGPTPSFGFEHLPIGESVLYVAADDAVLIDGLGPDGTDGASIVLGEVDFACLGLHLDRLFLPSPGDQVAFRSIDTSGATQAVYTATTTADFGTFFVGFELPGLPGSVIDVEVWDGDSFVGTVASATAPEIEIDFGLLLDLRRLFVLEYRLKPDELPGGLGGTIGLGGTVSINNGVGPGAPLLGDRIRFVPQTPAPADRITRIDVIGLGVPSVEIDDVVFGVSGVANRALRGNLIDTFGNGWVASATGPSTERIGAAVVDLDTDAIAFGTPALPAGDVIPPGSRVGAGWGLGGVGGTPSIFELEAEIGVSPIPVSMRLVTEYTDSFIWIRTFVGLIEVGRIQIPLEILELHVQELPDLWGGGPYVTDTALDSFGMVLEWDQPISIAVGTTQGGTQVLEGDRVEIVLLDPPPGSLRPVEASLSATGLDVLPVEQIIVAVPAPPCPADLDGSGDVGFEDLLSVLAAWGTCPDPGACPQDFDGDGAVGFNDLLAVLAAFGPCP